MDEILEYPCSADYAGELPADLDRLRGCRSLPRVRLADGRTAWLVTRYDHVRTVLADERFTRDVPAATPRGSSPVRTVNLNGRPHTDLRGLVAKAFTVRRIDGMRPRVQELTDGLLDRMWDQGPPADLVRHLAAPLPAIVICELLGFPAADREMLSRWCDRITMVGTGDPDPSAWQELGTYINDMAEAKYADPGLPPDADVLSILAHAHHDDGLLTREELVSLSIVVLAGGLETTQTAIGAGLIRLFRNPDQLEALRADPRLLDPAIEEILRYQPVIDHNRFQTALEDVRLGDHLVRAGDLVQPSINAANRDDAVFPDGARFEIARQPNPHLAFGHGAHHCLGAALARLELQTAFATLFRRFPTLAPAVPPERLCWHSGHVTLRLGELPVTW